MRSLIVGAGSAVVLALMVNAGCGSSDDGASNGDGGSAEAACSGFTCDQDGGAPGCVGLECQQVACAGGGTTSISGTVYDPAGKVPIWSATVYVPNAPLAELPEGASCDRCDAKVSGSPIVITTTDTSGRFKLDDVPAGADVPLIVQIGKWRRQVTIPTVPKCVETSLDASLTRLPRNRGEGHIPRIALTTGGADPLQCLLRKVGIDDAEFGVAGSDARVHLYRGGGNDVGGAAHLASSKFASTVAGGVAYPTAESLWSDPDAAGLKSYDLLLMGCEGAENETANAYDVGATKSAAAIGGMYKYASAGGRIFASHYHEVWFRRSADANVSGVATWSVDALPPPATPADPATTPVSTDISSAFPKATAMRDWLSAQNALVGGKLPIYDARADIEAVSADALSWISVANPAPGAGGKNAIQYMSFNAPVGAADAEVCGRVVVNDIHVAAGQEGAAVDDPSADFPTGCVTTELSAQQKALEFMLFDLSSCIQKDDQPPVQPK